MVSRLAVVALAAWAAVAVAPAHAQAQGILQYLFGYGAQRSYPGYGYRPYGSPYMRGPYDNGEAVQPGAAVRTLCVRTCDGYYFPVSFAAPRSALSRDADVCTASCGAVGRLFYHPTHGGDVETMVDLDGFAYSSMPNAFKYRKTLVPGCSCRPPPWSASELQRHRAYARGEDATAQASPAASPPSVPDATAMEAPRRPAALRPRAQPSPRWLAGSPADTKPRLVWPGDRP